MNPVLRSARGAALAALLLLSASARADEYRESVPAKPGGRLEVDLVMGAIEIETHDEPSVDVEADTGGWPGGMKLTLTSDGTNAKLESSGGVWFFGGIGARARVRVPERYSLELDTNGGSIEIEAVNGSVRAHTNGGGIELDGAVGPVELSTWGGSLRVEDVRGDTVLRTSGGKISVSEVVGTVDAETSGGSIRIGDVDGRVQARTSGGSISVRFAGAPSGVLETSGGGIEVEFPEGSGAMLEARTSGGRVYIHPDLTFTGETESSRVQGKLGSGGEPLLLETSGGNIRVRER
jgi:DUF4097 and DUF4098 domain-containing protein YvlB